MLTLLFFIFGFLLLFFGANFLVKGGSHLGLILGIPKLVVGLTIVSISTSMPEAVVSIIAQVFKGEGEIAIGNVVGSNIANIGLILGFASILRPQHFSQDVRKREIPVMLCVSVWLLLLMFTEHITRFWGILFLVALVLYLAYQTKSTLHHRKHTKREKIHAKTVIINLLWILAGGVILVIGGELFLKASIAIARYFQLSERVIGVTLVAIGSSLPELATSIVGVIKKETEIVIGNVVGSNLFNILFVIGSVATISPLSVSSTLALWDTPIMLGFSLLLAGMGWINSWITRWQGAALLVIFLGFLGVTLLGGGP